MRPHAPLFAGEDLSVFLHKRRDALSSEIRALPDAAILASTPSSLAAAIAPKYTVEPISVGGDIEIADRGTREVDVSGPGLALWRGVSSHGRHIASVRYLVYAIPYKGDRSILFCRPSTWSATPKADVTDSEILVEVLELVGDFNEMQKWFNERLDEIRRHIDGGQAEISLFNRTLERHARTLLENRRTKILADAAELQQLGTPVRDNAAPPRTYAVELAPAPSPATAPPAGFPAVPEPTLDMQRYEHILDIIANAAVVMERCPKAFETMREEALCAHLLVQLNGHYKGQATSETFNSDGRTDILIRIGGRNIFIGECKFWNGREVLVATIRQILGYMTWHDTKAAIIFFTRTRNISSALKTVAEVMGAHPNCKRQDTTCTREGALRYVMSHFDDDDRDLLLTVMMFQLPLPLLKFEDTPVVRRPPPRKRRQKTTSP